MNETFEKAWRTSPWFGNAHERTVAWSFWQAAVLNQAVQTEARLREPQTSAEGEEEMSVGVSSPREDLLAEIDRIRLLTNKLSATEHQLEQAQAKGAELVSAMMTVRRELESLGGGNPKGNAPLYRLVKFLNDEVRDRDGQPLVDLLKNLHDALAEVMTWISNWSPDFTDDDEWAATREKAEKALVACKEGEP